MPYCDRSKPGKHVCRPNAASVVICPNVNDSACIKNGCDPKTGACHLAKLATGTVCDDGDQCTKSTSCADGSCASGTYVCSCKTNEDCIGVDDGDLCNGVPYCDTSVPGNFKCKPNPSSAIHCPQNQNTQCLQNQCNPKTGGCGLQPFAGTKACDDDEPCTVNDTCSNGACEGGGAKDCNDKDACTTDACQKGKGCIHKLENCDDGNTCSVDKCDPATGKCDFGTSLKDGAACNADNNGCTLNDTCDKGACFSGIQVKCQLGEGACDVSVCQSEGPIQYKCLLGTKKDGEACDDASSCTIGSTCKTGKCQSTGQERLWTHVSSAADTDFSFSDVVAVGSEVIAAGSKHTLTGGKLTASFARLVRLSIDGKVLSTWEKKSDNPSAPVIAAGVKLLASGDLLTAGTLQNGGNWRVFVARLSADLKTQTYVRDHKPYEGVVVHALALLPDNGAVVVGDAFHPGLGNFIPLVRTSSSGHLLSAAKVASAVNNDVGHDVVTLPGGQVLIGGQTGAIDAKRYGLLVRADLTGKVIWRRQAQLPGAAGSFLTDVEYSAGVGITTTGSQTVDGASKYFIARYDLTGLRAWYRLSTGDAEPRDTLRLDSGKLLVAGLAPSGDGGKDAWAMLTDAAGNPTWQQSFDRLAGSTVKGDAELVATATFNNGFAIVGNVASSPKRAVIASISAWGQRTCSLAGGCGGIGPDKCDDGKPCTLDLCDTKTGKCQHTSLDGLICDPQDGCTVNAACEKGECKADPNGFKWVRGYPWHKGTGEWQKFAGARLLHGTRDGGTLIFGHYRSANSNEATTVHTATLRKVDHTGALLWEVEHPAKRVWEVLQSNGVYAYPQKYSLHERADGEIWLWGWTGDDWAHASGFIDRWDATGKFIGTITDSFATGSFTIGISALIERADGDIIQFNRNRFVRRDQALKVVATQEAPKNSGIPAIDVALEAAAGKTMAFGSFNGDGWVGRFAANGVREFGKLSTTAGAAMIDAAYTTNGNLSVAAVSAGSNTTVLRIYTFDVSNGSHLASVVFKSMPYGYPDVAVSQAPGTGWAFLVHKGYNEFVNHLYVGTLAGVPLYDRQLDGGVSAGMFALALGYDGESLIYGGYGVGDDGKARTYMHKTGPWGLAPCTTAAKCASKSRADCGDGDACTLDLCDPDKGCQNAVLDCDDGNACTTDSCDKKVGCLNKTIICADDGLACTTTVCQPVTVTLNLDRVAGGESTESVKELAGCNHRPVQDCIDGNTCTIDGCDKTGCTHKDADCDDNNVCTHNTCGRSGTSYKCAHPAVVCDDNEPCTIDACLKTSGCVFIEAAKGIKCEDDLVCKLGEGACEGGKCIVKPPGAISGCHSSQPSPTCVHTLNNSSGKLATYVGKLWIDADGDGKNPKLETCDMAAGGYQLKYNDGTTRDDAGWAGAQDTRCPLPAEGGGANSNRYVRYVNFPRYYTGKPGPQQIIIAKLKVPDKHTSVRLKFRLFAWTALVSQLDVRLQVGGQLVYDDGLAKLGIGATEFQGLLGCSPDKLWNGGYSEKVIDTKLAHTGGDLEMVLSGTPTAADTQGYVVLSDVQIWTK